MLKCCGKAIPKLVKPTASTRRISLQIIFYISLPFKSVKQMRPLPKRKKFLSILQGALHICGGTP